MALSKQTIAIIASRRAAKAAKPANDDAPKAPRTRLALPDFVDTVFAAEISLGTTEAGSDFITMKGCNVTLASGEPAVRTVMAFDDANAAVRSLIAAQKDVVATLKHTGPTLKVIGLEIDGQMVMFDQTKPIDKAA